VLRSG